MNLINLMQNMPNIGINNGNNNNGNSNDNNGNFTGPGNMQQMMMMMIFPMISSAFGTIFQSLINDIRTIVCKLFSYLYDKFSKFANKHIFKVYDEINELQIPIMEITSSYDRVSESISQEGLPIIWYLNTKVMLEDNKLKLAKLFEHGSLSSGQMPMLCQLGSYKMESQHPTDKVHNNNTLLFIPLSKTLQNKKASPILSKNGDELDSGNNSSSSSTQFGQPDQDLTTLTEIDKDIYMDFDIKYNRSGSAASGKATTTLILKSKKKSVMEIGNFYKSIKEKYDKMNSNKSGKLYVYNGSKATSQFGCYALDTSQSFDNIFIDNKQEIIDDILNLEDKEYYKQYGMKRKIGHLYVGPPGSGKTCFVTAIAKLTGRSVVYIPISRIQHNAELQSIIYDRKFNGVHYDMDEVIFIADELDSLNALGALKKSSNDEKDNESKEQQIKEQIIIVNTSGKDDKKQQTCRQHDQDFDKLNIGMVLNILDGNNDQDGMIIIGTANNCDKLDPAIYRNGRMELIKFKYMGRTEIANMVEHYYKVKLSPEQLANIRDDRTVQSLNLKNVCLKYIQKKKQHEVKIDDLIDEINYMFDHVDEVNEKIEKHLPDVPLSNTTIKPAKKSDPICEMLGFVMPEDYDYNCDN